MSDPSTHPVRVRFAPSPTGYLHIGGARTAMFNWIFVRKHEGVFVLRVEDTDQKRYIPDSERDIMDSLRWLGLEWDEGPDIGGPHGPYRQSERGDLYRQWADWLVDHGFAYRCNCTAERLAKVREQQEANKDKRGYDRHCRDLNLGMDTGPGVIRYKMPLDGETTVRDLIRGDMEFQNSELEDLVLLKSDGLPTYHLANVVDDHYMDITHIMRADEWIATAPLHSRLYESFGWTMPAIVHMPVILSPSGKGKLSKRDQAFQDGSVQVLVQVREFREAGYLPEAVVNFLLNTGWAFGDDREKFTVLEAMERFQIEDINPAPGRLPFEKLEWLNGVYIREMSVQELARRVKPYLEREGLRVDDNRLVRLVPLIQERIKTLSEAPGWVAFIFKDRIDIEDPAQLIQKNMDATSTASALKAVHDTLAGLDDFSHNAQETAMRALAERLGLKAGQLFGSVRVAISAQPVSPPLFESMEILGRDISLARIQAALDLLNGR